MPFGTESEDVVRMYQFILVCLVSLKLFISLSKRPDFNEKKSNLVNLWSLPCSTFPTLFPSSVVLVSSCIPNPIYFSRKQPDLNFFFGQTGEENSESNWSLIFRKGGYGAWTVGNEKYVLRGGCCFHFLHSSFFRPGPPGLIFVQTEYIS